jgi:hypothetical protein
MNGGSVASSLPGLATAALFINRPSFCQGASFFPQRDLILTRLVLQFAVRVRGFVDGATDSSGAAVARTGEHLGRLATHHVLHTHLTSWLTPLLMPRIGHFMVI